MFTGAVAEIPLAERSFSLLAGDVSPAAWRRLRQAEDQARSLLAGRTLWTVNSTPSGGGVAEMQRTLFPYWRGSGVHVRWLVLDATPAFFRLTKRIHNMLHGEAHGVRLGVRATRLYDGVSRVAAAAVLERIAPGDVVMLHDPQTAGLVPVLKTGGAIVIWRCHVGADVVSEPVEEAWRFLVPYVRGADRQVFTRAAYVPPGLDPARVDVAAPAIDPCSPKNQPLEAELTEAILQHAGLAMRKRARRAVRPPDRTVAMAWGGEHRVDRRCTVLRKDRRARLGEDRLVVALSRWDRLKDPLGILWAFAEHVAAADVRLVLAGPPATWVRDDPEGAGVLRAVRAAWHVLPAEARERIDVAIFPMVDMDENALIVNALQRRADVIVKKSLQEGFGLGVTEALWKRRPVVATNVGGHRDQIEHRRTGLLVDDPSDLAGFAAAITQLLGDPAAAFTMAATGHDAVRDRFLADRHFDDWMSILAAALAETDRPAAPHAPAPPSVLEGESPASEATQGAVRARERAVAARERAEATRMRSADDERAGSWAAAELEDHLAVLHDAAAHAQESTARTLERLRETTQDGS